MALGQGVEQGVERTVPGISNHGRSPAETPMSVHSLDLARAKRELLAAIDFDNGGGKAVARPMLTWSLQ